MTDLSTPQDLDDGNITTVSSEDPLVAPEPLQMASTPPVPTHSSEHPIRPSFQTRVAIFQDIISEPKIDFVKLRGLAFQGVPELPGLRSIYWKLLLSYLPAEKAQWDDVLKKNRETYQVWINELIIDPHKGPTINDHPLSTDTTSQWNMYFRDKELLEEIDKDVRRTLPHLHFFNHDASVGSTEHYEALKRILFIYAKLNPGIRYVQGMNEILGPIYYIFAKDSNPLFQGYAESDTFFCFTNLMSEIRDNFCKILDKSDVGITGRISQLNKLVQVKDHELWSHFESKGLNPQYYSFRWLTLLLSQEFDLPDVLRVWDSLFADPYRFQFLLYLCVAMLVCVRDTLLDGGFADNLKLLQNYPVQDIHILLKKAEELMRDTYQPPPPRKLTPIPIKTPSRTASSTPSYTSSSIHPPSRPIPFTEKLSSSQGSSSDSKVESQQDKQEEGEEEVQVKEESSSFLLPPKPFDATEDEEEDGVTVIIKTPQLHPLQ